MTGAEAKKLSIEEIAVELKRLRERMFELRNQSQTEKVEDTSQFVKVRRDIARLLTERTARHEARPAGASPAPAARAPKASRPAAKKPAARKTAASKPRTKAASKG